ncbi:MAG: HNH endonuclease, partial [Acetatifactor sp.]|nr:HNH endonuclease [Acetatifactor sp.]
SRKRNTYKYGLVKSILDNLFNGIQTDEGYFFVYKELFAKFAENYWNLVVKYDLHQMRSDGRSQFSKIEMILKSAVEQNSLLVNLEFESIDGKEKEDIISKVTAECKKYVVGALYDDLEGMVYSFDLKGQGLTVCYKAYEFMLKYKTELEKLNYYAWAKFLEKVNDDNALVRIIDKLELATPRRSDLSIYREVLRKEFEENTCFYCGRGLGKAIHVDHFIPWIFVKDDKIWNFVLACPICNERKNNRVPTRDYIVKIEKRNERMKFCDSQLIRADFEMYSDGLLGRMWSYAKLSGIKEYVSKY